MGSRIRFSLSAVHQVPGIKIELQNVYLGDPSEGVSETQATIVFPAIGELGSFGITMDTSTYEGRIELSCDFNFFRYPSDDQSHWSRRLLRQLYENSIDFKISH